MRRVLAVVVPILLCSALPARAAESGDFMQRFYGDWIGSGQVLFGAPGTEFACALRGDPSAGPQSFALTGECRMGTMAAPVHAELRYNAETQRYYGAFMGGANADGADLVGARAGDSFSLKLVRGEMQGRLAASTIGADRMKIVIYYHDPKSSGEVPVATMGFTRKEVITGSIAH